MKKISVISAIALVAAVGLTACDTDSKSSEQETVEKKAASNKAYLPENNVELNNYNKAQKLYDDPSAILWCTSFPSSASAPIVTVPIAGKLTTSGTSYFSPTNLKSNSSGGMVNVPNRSVDSMFHGDSFYRYGFSPSGQYFDFSNSMELLCSTTLMDYQRQNTFVEGVGNNGGSGKEGNAKGLDIQDRQKRAEKALKDDDPEKAMKILRGDDK